MKNLFHKIKLVVS